MSQQHLDGFIHGGILPETGAAQPLPALACSDKETVHNVPDMQMLIEQFPALDYLVDDAGYTPFDASVFPKQRRRQRSGATFEAYSTKNYGDDVEIYKDILTREQEAYLAKFTSARMQILNAISDPEAKQQIVRREHTSLEPSLFDFDVELSDAQLQQLEQVLQDGQLAKDEFILRNLRLVMKMSKEYLGFAKHLSLDDLIQEGNIGLEHAVDMFDWTKGFKFSTYAKWWIRNSLNRAVGGKERAIRLPLEVDEDVRKLRKALQKLEQGQEPDTAALAAETKLSPARIASILPFVTQSVLSLDVPNSSGETLADSLETKGQLDESLDLLFVRQTIETALNTLDERRRYVVARYFGLFGLEPKNMPQIAEELGVKRSRIGQLYNEGLAKVSEYLVAQSTDGL